VGGGVGLILGVGLFPAQPLQLLRGAERRVLTELATTVEQTVEMLVGSIDPGAEWAVARGAAVHRALAELASARATARANVRLAPRRWRLRPQVDAELTRLSRFDALAEAVLGTARAAIRPSAGLGPVPTALRDELTAIGTALRRLACTEQPWPKATLDDVHAIAERTLARAAEDRIDRGAIVGALLQTTALDLAAVSSADLEAGETR
jgi:hypothetical protein